MAAARVSLWKPLAHGEWSTIVDSDGDAHLAHAPAWHGAIARAYGHVPLYLRAESAGGEQAVLPAFIVRRWLSRPVVTSMPFLDGGGPSGSSATLGGPLLERLVQEARAAGARRVEVRSAVPLDLPVEPRREKIRLVLDLEGSADRMWKGLDGKVRNQVRKAERSGLSVEFGRADKLDDFYEPFAVNMRDLGSPVHGREFFRAVLEAFGDAVRIGVVYLGARAVGGLIAVAFRDTLSVPWASSLREYRALCPNMLLYWEAIRLACGDAFRRFDFGRSSQSSGTYAFKKQWGAREVPLFWYTVPTGDEERARAAAGSDWRRDALARAWSRLPLALTNRLGPQLRGQLTQ
jgi:FemAB-related protein (PEP-CTERM system-associated)